MKKTFILLILIGCLLPGTLRAQAFNWAAGGVGGCEGWGEAVDPWGNIYGAGWNNPAGGTQTFGSITLSGYGDYASILVKFSPSGNVLWAASTKSGSSRPLGVATDMWGNAYLLAWYMDTSISVGSFVLNNPAGSPGSIELFIAKFTPSGTVVWAKNICNAVCGILPYWNQDGAIAANGADVFITASFQCSTINIGSFFLTNTDPTGATLDLITAKFDSSGNAIWVKKAGGAADDVSNVIAITPAGNVCISGSFSSPAISFGGTTLSYHYPSNLFLAKYDSSGNILWASSPDGLAIDGNVTTDSGENVYVTGTYNTILTLGTYVLQPDTLSDTVFSDAFLAKYDASGITDWVKKIHANRDDNGYGVATDPCGNVWMTGGMEKDSMVSIDGNIYVAPHQSRDPMYFGGWSAAGDYITGGSLPTGGDDNSFIRTDGAGNMYFGGDYWGGPYTIGGDTLNDPTHKFEDLSVFKYQTVYVKDTSPVSSIACLADSSDSVALQAPPGYPYYRWDNGSYALTRTVYTPGTYILYGTGRCGSGVLKDVFNVGYGKLDTINASQDTTTCLNANAVIMAPAGYMAYYWSNGGISRLDTINAPGDYIAVCEGSCTIPTLYDTFVVTQNSLNLYFSLGDDTAICDPLTLEVDLPAATYLWQDGTMGNTDLANQTGIYFATAYEQNCFHTDSISVNYLNLVQNLPDTAFCKGRPIELTLHGNVPPGARALWNTGNTQDSITVTNPGRYWITVMEAACIGSDTMTLAEAECACNPVLPEAFTPNDDGKNDFFYPIIEKACDVYDYIFCVYNRWGQMVFSTRDPNSKWDGKYFGTPQDIGTYMCYVEYRVQGSYSKYIAKGDFTLIR